MSFEVDASSETEATVSITVPSARIEEAIQLQLQDLMGKVKLPGFRPGKVPRNIIRKKYGEAIETDVRQKLLQDEFRSAIEENDLRPVQAPTLTPEHLEPKESGDLQVEFQLELIPRFVLGEYKGLRVSAPPVTIKDEDIQREIENLQHQRGTLDPVEGAAGDGDTVIADIQMSFLDGTSLPVQEERLIDTKRGSVDGIPCEAAIGHFVGLERGSEAKLSVEIPEDHPLEEHRGKTAIAMCTVKDIRRVNLPELDSPEFLQEFGVESVDALREIVAGRMNEEVERRKHRLLEAMCVDQLLERHPFTLPPKHLQEAVDAEKERVRKEMTEQGAAPEDIERQLLEGEGRLQQQSERRLRETIILDRIAEAEKIEVQEEQIQHHFAMMSQVLQMPAQQLFDHFAESGSLHSVVEGIRRDNTRRLLRESAITTDEMDRAETSSTPESSEETT